MLRLVRQSVCGALGLASAGLFGGCDLPNDSGRGGHNLIRSRLVGVPPAVCSRMPNDTNCYSTWEVRAEATLKENADGGGVAADGGGKPNSSLGILVDRSYWTWHGLEDGIFCGTNGSNFYFIVPSDPAFVHDEPTKLNSADGAMLVGGFDQNGNPTSGQVVLAIVYGGNTSEPALDGGLIIYQSIFNFPPSPLELLANLYQQALADTANGKHPNCVLAEIGSRQKGGDFAATLRSAQNFGRLVQ